MLAIVRTVLYHYSKGGSSQSVTSRLLINFICPRLYSGRLYVTISVLNTAIVILICSLDIDVVQEHDCKVFALTVILPVSLV